MNTSDVKRVLEGALLCAAKPLTVSELRQVFSDDVEVSADTVRALLETLALIAYRQPITRAGRFAHESVAFDLQHLSEEFRYRVPRRASLDGCTRATSNEHECQHRALHDRPLL